MLRRSKEQVTQDLPSELSSTVFLILRKKVSCWEPQRPLLKGGLGERLSAELTAQTGSPTSIFFPGFCWSELWVLPNKISYNTVLFSLGLAWYVLRLPASRQHPQSKPCGGFSVPFLVSWGAGKEVRSNQSGLCQSQPCLSPWSVPAWLSVQRINFLLNCKINTCW